MSRTLKSMTAWLMMITMLFSVLPTNISLADTSTITINFDETSSEDPTDSEDPTEPEADAGDYGKAYLGVMVDGVWKRIAAGTISRGGSKNDRYYFADPISPSSYQGVEQTGLLWSTSGYNEAAAAVGTRDGHSSVLGINRPSASTIVYMHAKENYEFYTVRFLNWDGTVLKTHIVVKGGSAQPPDETPNKTNAAFIGWDADFSQVTSSLNVTAQFTTTQYVEFVDAQHRVIDSRSVAIGDPIGALPEVPSFVGGTDGCWMFGGEVVTAETPVTEKMVVTAAYTPFCFDVTFMDRGQQVGETQSVAYGQAAAKPETYIAGTKIRETDTMLFLGWDRDTDTVTEPMTVNALFTYDSNRVFFFVGSEQISTANGTDITEGVLVSYGESVPEGSIPQAGTDFDAPDGMTFAGWDAALTDIRHETIATAQFTKDQHAVTFLDGSGDPIKTVQVEYDDTVEVPAAYEVGRPFGNAGIFSGWEAADASYSQDDLLHVRQDMTFTATFRSTITVRYLDRVNTALDSPVISQQTLRLRKMTAHDDNDNPVDVMAATAEPPTNHYIAGSSGITVDGVDYTFIGFSHDHVNLTQDIDIYALYQTTPQTQTGSHIRKVAFYVRYDGAVPYEPTQHSTSLYTKVAYGYADVTAANDPAKTISMQNNTSNQQGDWVQGYGNVLPRLVNGGPVIAGMSDDMFVEWYVIKFAAGDYSYLHVDGVVRCKNTYKVVYYMLGGTPTILDTADYPAGVQAPVSKTTPSRTGYTFMGWALEENGSVVYQPGDTIPEMPSHNVYLYAVWVSNSETLRDVTVSKQWYPAAPDGAAATLALKRRIVDTAAGTETADASFAETCEIIGNGSFTFRSLPIYPDISNKKIYYVYYTEEIGRHSGYAVQVYGLKVYNIKLADFSVVKAWQHPDGTAYADHDQTVAVTLRGVTELDTVTYRGSVCAGQTAQFENVPLTDRYGNAYTFTLTEAEDDAYKLISSDFDPLTRQYRLVNRLTSEKQTFSVRKVWDDMDNADGLRPGSLVYQLSYTDAGVSKTINSQPAFAKDGYGCTFKDVPVYGTDGHRISDFALREMTTLAGCTVEITQEDNVFTVTNRHTPDRVTVNVRKAWEDDNDRDGLRPDSVSVTLYWAVDGGTSAAVTAADGLLPKDGSATLILSDTNQWKARWQNLLKKKDGGIIRYSVVETQPAGDDYDAPTYSKDKDGTLVVTNHHDVDETVGFAVSKTWADEGFGALRPTGVTATLQWSVAGGEAAPVTAEIGLLPEGASADRVLNAANGWTAAWEHLKANHQGQPVTYTVKETKIGDSDAAANPNYTVSYTATTDGVTITNAINLVNLTVTKEIRDETSDSENGMKAAFTFTVNGAGVNETFRLGNGGSKTIPVFLGKAYSISESVNGSVWATMVDGQAQASKQVTPATDTTVAFVNIRKPTEDGVTVTKVWSDHNDRYGLRPKTQTLQLKQGAVEINSAALSGATNTWTKTFTTNAEGKALPALGVNGEAVIYTADEANAPTGYSKMLSGLTVTNTLNTTDLSGRKSWVDGGNAANRPKRITVSLMYNGEKIAATTTDAEQNWAFSFADIPTVFAEDCTVTEAAVEGYTPAYDADSLDIINSIHQEYVTVSGTKTWVDGGKAHNNAAELTITLTRTSATVTEPETVEASIAWTGDTYTFGNLPKYDAEGCTYTYAVSETQVADYDAPVQDGSSFINRISQKQTSVTVRKIWNDADNQDGIRPQRVVMTLCRDGQPTDQTVILTSMDGWADKSFEKLDVYDPATGAAYAYTVAEGSTDGYTTDYGELTDGIITVENKHVPSLTSVTVYKVWRDGGAERPDISVTLKGSNGIQRESTPEGWVKQGDMWSCTFGDLPMKDNGENVVYTAEEAALEGYSTYYSEDTLTITNVIHTSVTAAKAWSDFTDETLIALYRPAMVTVTLSADNGAAIADAQKTIIGSGSVSWSGLDAYTVHGAKIVYTVTETAVPGYTTTYLPADGSADENGRVTVVNTIDKTDVAVTKHWVDEGFAALRPDSFELALCIGETLVDTKTATTANTASQMVTFSVPALDAVGKAITYTVTETAMTYDGTRIALNEAGFAGGYIGTWSGLTVTNTIERTVKDVTLTKVWQDQSNAFEARPATLTVQLNGLTGHEISKTFDSAKANSQTLNFGRQPRYLPGTAVEIDYTGTETKLGETALDAQQQAVGYTASCSEDGKTIINTLMTSTVDVTVNWVDSGNLFDTRPNTVTVLLSNGAMQTADVTSEGSQTVSFTVPAFVPGTTTPAAYTAEEMRLGFDKPAGSVQVIWGEGGGYDITADGLTITNTLQRVSVPYTKTWENDHAAYRPTTYTVALSAKLNGKPLSMSTWAQEIPLTQTKRELSGSWTRLPKYNYNLSENAIAYTVAETHIGAAALDRDDRALGYQMIRSVAEGVTAITNRLIGVSFKVTKVWLDDGKTKRPDITMQLKADGADYGAPVHLAKDQTYTWKNLPSTAADGTAIVYTVAEMWPENTNGYEAFGDTVYGTNNTATVTNRLYVDVTGTKTWRVRDTDALPDTMLVLNATVNGKTSVVEQEPVWTKTDAVHWSYTFRHLPKADEKGSVITYTVTENDAAMAGFRQIAAADGSFINTQLISVSGRKIWHDNGNAEAQRPNTVTLQLYKNDETDPLNVAPVWVNNGAADAEWAYVFENLPYSDENGPITYRVAEVTPDAANAKLYAYHQSQKGNDITNTLYGTVTVTKVWDDDSNNDGMREAAVKNVSIQLKRGDHVVYTTPLTTYGDTIWYTFIGVPLYDETGAKIIYTAGESAMAQNSGYTAKATALTVTNTHVSDNGMAMRFTKVWDDENNNDGARPASIEVTLKSKTEDENASRNEGEPRIVTGGATADTWTTSWSNLPKYRGGKEIIYTVVETRVTGYTASETVYDRTSVPQTASITNSRASALVTVNGRKIWRTTGTHPDSSTLILTLKRSYGTVSLETVPATDYTFAWTNDVYRFSGLKRYIAGNSVTYTVVETVPEGYQAAYGTPSVDQQGNTFISLTNTQLSGVVGCKAWHDGLTSDQRTDLMLTLYRQAGDGEKEIVSVTPTIDKTDSLWTYNWGALPTFEGETAITYTVDEQNVPEGYTKTVSGMTVHNSALISVSGEKLWSDDDDRDVLRPDSITVHLNASNGAVYSDVTTDASQNWQYQWTNLPAFDAEDGFAAITYFVTETETPDGYTVSGGTAADSYDITNTHDIAALDVTVTKTWEDNGNQDAKRPGSITLNLYEDGSDQPIDSKEMTADAQGIWQPVTFEDLPMNHPKAQGAAVAAPITYHVEEVGVNGYTTTYLPQTAEVTGQSGTVAVTNTHKPMTKQVTVIKKWNSIPALTNLQPAAVVVQLCKNSAPVDGSRKTLTAPDWTAAWTELPVYENGELIAYTVSEISIDGVDAADSSYVTEKTRAADGTEDDVTVTLSNTLSDTEYSVRKEWIGAALTSIEVTLMNGTDPIDTRTLTADADGVIAYSWTGLPKQIGGREAVYSVVETALAGYTTDYAVVEGVCVITNTEVKDYTVEKIWVTGSETHPSSIDVTLTGTAEGCTKEYAITLTADTWKGTFEKVPTTTPDGETIDYTISEHFAGMDGYHAETHQDGYAFTLTNTLLTQVTGTKLWVDGADGQQLRPDTMNVTLLRNGQPVTADMYGSTLPTQWTRPENDSGTWRHTYTNLPKYDERGNAYTYTLREIVPPGYRTADNGNTLTLTNTLLTTLTGTKTWVDGSDALALRPKQITLTVWRGQTQLPSTDYGISWDQTAGDVWQYIIIGLPYGTADEAIAYTVKETMTQPASTEYAYAQTADDGRNFTNTLIYTDLAGSKTWVDAGLTSRPEGITVQLCADGTLVADASAISWKKTDDTWSFAFANQPVFKEDGARIAYTVQETRVGTLNVTRSGAAVTDSFTVGNDTYRYRVTENGMTVTNTLQRDVYGTKVWADDDNRFALRPAMTDVTFTLTENGAEGMITADATNANRCLVAFGFQDAVADNAAAVYTMQESKLTQYEASLDGMTITNTLKTTSLNGTKTWVDGSRAQTERPSITLTVYANGTKLAVQPKAEDITWTNQDTDVWRYTITNLPAVDAAGNMAAYTVTETMGAQVGDSYTLTTTNNIDLINTVDQKYIDVAGTKTWLDPEGTTHGDVVIELIRDGDTAHPIDTCTITAERDTYLFSSLPMYALGENTENDGHPYAYTVQEQPHAGYAARYTANSTNGSDIRNVILQQPRSVTVTKRWDDDSNRDNKREPVTLELLRDSKAFTQDNAVTATVMHGDMNSESFTFEGLDTYFIDEELNLCTVYVYTVEEITDLSGSGYEAPMYSEDHLTVTNRRVPETVHVTVTKLWDDDTNRDGLRTGLDSVTIKVLNDGDAEEQTLTFTRPDGAAANDWGTVTTMALPKYWNEGQLITYTAKEQNVLADYTVSCIAEDAYYLGVINVHEPAATVITGGKTWNDGGLAHNNAEEVALTLTAAYNGIVETLPNVPTWNGSTYTFADLPIYKQGMEGVALTYDVTETAVPGYAAKKNGTDFVNTALSDVTITLNWVDGDQFYRPSAPLVLELLANGVRVDSVTVANPTTTGVTWNYTFADKPVYDETGKPIVYTVNQPVTPGNGRYDAEQSGLVVTNTAYVNVTFVDFDGRVIKTDRILMGDSTTAPDDPVRAGYRFTYWNGGIWVTVTRDQTIRANYIALTDPIEDPNIPLAGGRVQNVGDCFD